MKTNSQKKTTVRAAQTFKSRNGTSGKNERKIAHRQSKFIQKASDGAPPRSTEGKKNSIPVAGTPVSRNSTSHAAVHDKKNIPATAAPVPESSGAIHTASLKKFATEARRKLIDQIGARLTFVLNEETAELKGKTGPIASLYRHIAQSSEKQVVEQVAYIWFNRFIALRFMDVNEYTTPRVLTPANGHTVPELLQDAKSGSFPDTLTIDRTRVMHLLDGKIKHPNPQGEAFRMLIVASCNAWNTVMPFLFEPIEDWTELLLPDDLLSDHSIVADIRSGMSAEDCRNEEVIGWLYQFYIAEKKDEVIGGLKKNIKITEENIPAATQLFTPHWIVRYMVENTLGKLWMQLRPSSDLRAHMEYYIEQEPSGPQPEGVTGIKDITFLDPCAGSGHILVYAFDLLHRMYEEEGYDIHEIPSLILQHNLFGLEIDDRAAALAGFALCMKGRSVDRRFFKRGVSPNVLPFEKIVFEDEEFENYSKKAGKKVFTPDFIENLKMLEQGKNFGSLIRPKVIEGEAIRNVLKLVDVSGNLFLVETHRKVMVGLELIERLQRKYACVVTNPPYMGGKGMNETLKKFADKEFPSSKGDTFAMFLDRGIGFVLQNGFYAMVTMQSWMFLSSFEDLRKRLLYDVTIETMVHMANMVMRIAFGTSATVWRNIKNKSYKAHYSFVDSKDLAENGVPKKFPVHNNRLKTASAEDFGKIPGSPVAYWVSEKVLSNFNKHNQIYKVSISEGQNITANNDKYLRNSWEVECLKIKVAGKWTFYAKGGNYRKWFGNLEYVIDWSDEARKHYHSHSSARIIPKYLRFRDGITWTLITSAKQSFRLLPNNATFDKTGSSIFFDSSKYLKKTLLFLNTKIVAYLIRLFNSTISLQVDDVRKLPFSPQKIKLNLSIYDKLIHISKNDWDSNEISFDFKFLNLISNQQENEQNKRVRKKSCKNITHVNEEYKKILLEWQSMISETQRLEEENNRIFIDAYGLDNELTPEVPIHEITLTCNPPYRYGPEKTEEEYAALQKADTMRELLSYCVGVLFGRYSLDKPGLILANQGERVENYITKVFGEHKKPPKDALLPDDDAIIPILDDEYFPDDVVNRTREFLSKAFSPETVTENIAFIEEALGKDLYKFYTREFYNDHIKRYKKRPIYWLFASPKGTFRALIYMHRYRSDTLSQMLSNYLRPLIEKLKEERTIHNRTQMSESVTITEKSRAQKRLDTITPQIHELEEYEKELYKLAAKRIEIDLDDGVRVNYPKFAPAIVPIKGLEKGEK